MLQADSFQRFLGSLLVPAAAQVGHCHAEVRPRVIRIRFYGFREGARSVLGPPRAQVGAAEPDVQRGRAVLRLLGFEQVIERLVGSPLLQVDHPQNPLRPWPVLFTLSQRLDELPQFPSQAELKIAACQQHFL